MRISDGSSDVCSSDLLFPAELPELGPVVLAYVDALTQLGHALLRGIALALGLEDSWLDDHLTADPLVLFRIFRYPPVAEAGSDWGVARVGRASREERGGT